MNKTQEMFSKTIGYKEEKKCKQRRKMVRIFRQKCCLNNSEDFFSVGSFGNAICPGSINGWKYKQWLTEGTDTWHFTNAKLIRRICSPFFFLSYLHINYVN